MKNLNNKSQSNFLGILIILLVIMVFSVVTIIAVIQGYLLFAIGNDYVVLPLYNSSVQFNASPQITAAFEQVPANYQGLDLGFIDDMWFLSYMVLVIGSFFAAYRARGANWYAWLSMLTYGLMLVLYVAGFFSVILTWLYSDILLNLFTNLAVSTPKLAYYVLNFGWVFLLHASALLLVIVLDFDFAFIKNRKKKELAAFDDEIV